MFGKHHIIIQGPYNTDHWSDDRDWYQNRYWERETEPAFEALHEDGSRVCVDVWRGESIAWFTMWHDLAHKRWICVWKNAEQPQCILETKDFGIEDPWDHEAYDTETVLGAWRAWSRQAELDFW